MPRRVTAPRGVRRRLTVALVLAVGVSAGALAVGSFLFVRHSRLQDSLDRALNQTELNLRFADQNLPARPTPLEVGGLLSAYGRSAFETVIMTGGQSFSSALSIGSGQIPPDLRDLVDQGYVAYRRSSVAGTPYLVTGAPAKGQAAQLFFFFSESGLESDLSQLAEILLAGWVAVVLVAGLVSSFLARRTLEPVAAASAAARSLAEGLLDTRLDVGGDDEFGAWATSFNEMAEALEGKISALSAAQARERRFTSDVAHELRTPVAALVSEASLLRDHLDAMPPEARRPAELLVSDVGRLRRMVEDLMEISRLDAGRAAVRPEPVDLASLVEAAIRARGWEARVDLRADPVVLTTDRRRLERIVANLVGNALEHGGRGVSVRVGRDGTGAFVEVSDAGPGIAAENVGHLFERFYKADPSRTSPGSGLGLSIALENARLLGGDLDVWSEVGMGSRFTLRLPATEPLPDREAGVAAAGQSGEP